jgi:hypothetical protein
MINVLITVKYLPEINKDISYSGRTAYHMHATGEDNKYDQHVTTLR